MDALRGCGRDRARRSARHARAGTGGRAGGVPRAAARRPRAAAAARSCSSSTTSTSCAPRRRCAASSSCSRGAPAQLRTFVVSRRDPKLGLHRLRLAGELVEIRGADLDFTAEEAGELMAAAGVSVGAGDVGRLHRRTEGWAAGLRLAAMSLARHDAPDRFVAEFSGSERTVADYLLGEVLASQPPEVRTLLLRTCILERVTGPLADLLTGRDDGARLLHELEEANALVVAVDVAREWFRYHHLLARPAAARAAARGARRGRRACTGSPPAGTPSTATRSRRSATRSSARTGRSPASCSAATGCICCSTARRRRSARCSPPFRPGGSTPTRSWRRSLPPTASPSRAGQRPTPSSRPRRTRCRSCRRRAATAPRRRSRPSSCCARGGSATSVRPSTRRARCCTARALRPASSSRRSRCSTSGSPRAGRCAGRVRGAPRAGARARPAARAPVPRDRLPGDAGHGGEPQPPPRAGRAVRCARRSRSRSAWGGRRCRWSGWPT